MIPGIGEAFDVASGMISLARGDYAGAALSMASAIPIVGNIAGAAKIASKVDDGLDAVRAANRMELARIEGMAGEIASGIKKNTDHIASLSGKAKYRVPDELTGGVLREVKNVDHLSFTPQLQDYAAWADRYGYKFHLTMREDTVLDDALMKAIENGDIIPESILW